MPRKARPTTPSMMLGPLPGPNPNSPPQSPTSSASPVLNLNRKKLASRHLPPYHNITRPVVLDDSNIQPTGNGHQFSFTPNRFAQLSPRTSSEDSDEDDEDEETESESEAGQKEVQLPTLRPVSDDDDEEEDSDDEEDDSDDEEDDDDDDEEDSDDEDDDEDVRMSFCPPAPAPAPMPAWMPPAMSAPMPPAMSAPMPRRMAVDSSSEEDSDDEEDEVSESESESEADVPPPAPELVQEVIAAVKANFTLEELSDFDPMDQDRSGTIAPSGFSSPASERSRSRNRRKSTAELPRGMMRDMRNLNCSASDPESSDDDLDTDAAAHREFVRAQRELRMRKRRLHGSSIGKRTVSERSDSDNEDCWAALDDPDAVGSSARRLRRRIGDRRSFIHLQFQDPPPPRIDELDEPDSEVEGVFFCDGETLARELPYYTMEIMEYESPSP